MERRTKFEGSELPLTALRNGETGIVTSIKAGCGECWGFKRRLMDMGLTPGAEVVVVKSAPFFGPLEVTVRGSRLALGRGMAERILVVRKKVV
jgi:Fe2+ transport system protein FeoA